MFYGLFLFIEFALPLLKTTQNDQSPFAHASVHPLSCLHKQLKGLRCRDGWLG